MVVHFRSHKERFSLSRLFGTLESCRVYKQSIKRRSGGVLIIGRERGEEVDMQKVFTWAKRGFGGANGNARLTFRRWRDGRAIRNTYYADQDGQ